jgi:hypothetical protein
MNQEHIKRECELIYQTIKNSNDRLTEIRKNCKHPNQFNGIYSWRPGAMDDAIICSDCGELIKIIDNNPPIITTTN